MEESHMCYGAVKNAVLFAIIACIVALWASKAFSADPTQIKLSNGVGGTLVEVVKGRMALKSENTMSIIEAGSSITVKNLNDIQLEPGMTILFGSGGATLKGTDFPEGTRLFVGNGGQLEIQ
jgi:hypothetical protein